MSPDFLKSSCINKEQIFCLGIYLNLRTMVKQKFLIFVTLYVLGLKSHNLSFKIQCLRRFKKFTITIIYIFEKKLINLPNISNVSQIVENKQLN